MKFDISIFRKSVENIQVSLKLIITVTLCEDQYIFMTKSRPAILRLRNVLDKFVEKIKTYILCSTTFPENRDFYEVVWKTILEQDRPYMTI